MINKDVFREYDIRGIYGPEITNDLALELGKAIGTVSDGTVIVGHDTRESSNALNMNLINGLLSSGVEVIDVGLVTTPMLYYARELFDKNYAVMITASHLGREYNGFKICDSDGVLCGDEIQKLYNMIINKEYKTGTGHITSHDIMLEYREMIDKKIFLGERKLKCVVDCGNGTTTIINPSIMEDWGIELIPLYCENDPSFPNHIADPAVDENMKDLEKKVKETNADLGIAFDGDGDRIGLVDEKGNLVRADMIMLIIWKALKDTFKNKTASFDVKCSKALEEALENMGLTISFNKTGHSNLKKAIKDNNYDFAGEFSGHLCFNDEFYGFDDALYNAGRLLKIFSNSSMQVSDYLKDVPFYVTSPEKYIKVGEDKKELIVNKVYEYAKEKGYRIIDIDGVRIEYPDGFALVRKSNTSPCITTRFEGKTETILKSYQDEIMNIINKEI